MSTSRRTAQSHARGPKRTAGVAQGEELRAEPRGKVPHGLCWSSHAHSQLDHRERQVSRLPCGRSCARLPTPNTIRLLARFHYPVNPICRGACPRPRDFTARNQWNYLLHAIADSAFDDDEPSPALGAMPPNNKSATLSRRRVSQSVTAKRMTAKRVAAKCVASTQCMTAMR